MQFLSRKEYLITGHLDTAPNEYMVKARSDGEDTIRSWTIPIDCACETDVKCPLSSRQQRSVKLRFVCIANKFSSLLSYDVEVCIKGHPGGAVR